MYWYDDIMYCLQIFLRRYRAHMKQVQCVMQKKSTSSSTNLVVISWRWSKDGRVFGSSFQQSIIIWYLPIKRIWNMEIVVEDLEYLRDVKSRNITHKVWLKHKHKRNHNSRTAPTHSLLQGPRSFWSASRFPTASGLIRFSEHAQRTRALFSANQIC